MSCPAAACLQGYCSTCMVLRSTSLQHVDHRETRVRRCPAKNLSSAPFFFRPHGRTRTAGHPGGPPPAPAGRKRRKNHKRHHRTRCVAEEHTPQTRTASEKSHHAVRARMNRKRHERRTAGVGGSCRDKSHTGQGGCSGSDGSCCPAIREVLVSKRGRPFCPVHPASASCVHARSMSPDLNRHHLRQQGPEVAGGAGRGWREAESTDRATNRPERYATYKADARRRRDEDGCIMYKDVISAQPQTGGSREDPPNRTLGPASGDRMRASLLKVR